jgi:hypothetical protein
MEAKERLVVKGMVRTECNEKAKGEEKYLVQHEVSDVSL